MKERQASLDHFRVAAALLVAAIHTSPLASFWAEGDFWLTRVLARLAVPFFFMVSGYFLAKSQWKSLPRFLKKTALLYGISILLYLPLNLYANNVAPGEWVRAVLLDGTFYHLWYFPAVLLGALVAFGLSRLRLRASLPLAGLLYLVGLGGDSYYGLVSALPWAKAMYDGLFHVVSYTRNGLFFAPLFLLLGAAGLRWRPRFSLAGLLLSLAAMSGEAFWLRSLGAQRHDSMYLFLPVCSVFLFSLLLSRNQGQDRAARTFSMLFYVLHPWCIVLVRGGAKLLGLEGLFVENSLGHFLAVAALSGAVSALPLLLQRGKPSQTGRAWRELDLAALHHNAAALQRRLGPRCRLMAVVKADAYGHGAVPVAKALQREKVRAFAVATLEEGVALRKRGIRGTILILGYTAPFQSGALARWRLTQAVVEEDYARRLSAQGKRVRVHLAADTGMHRLGIPAEDLEAFRRVYQLPHLKIEGVFSHLCAADSAAPEDAAFTQHQAEAFRRLCRRLEEAGCPAGQTHLLASYGIFSLPTGEYAFARAGIALYGVGSGSGCPQPPVELWPVLSLRARVAAVHSLAPGETAGYGRAFRAERPTRLAVVAIGYADGLPRDLAQRGGQVLLHGRHAPIVGRLCMDQLLVDVTDLDEVRGGNIATLIGRDGASLITAEELAGQCGTITNELLSRLGRRLGLCLLE
ncbi:MAG TPA: serine racemase VanT catalytic subunit [Candidatus Caccousia avistercoris]|nr:serine racemase VanT catalytic subunit [Candidatus Caccousia avistercoris]